MHAEIVLEPDLAHCIEAVARKEHERLLRLLLGSEGEDPKAADELELLRLFLESADFGFLRARCDDPLVAGKHVRVRLRWAGRVPEWSVEMQ
jgi:hypothetical protein